MRHAPDAQLGGAVRHQQPDRARTLHLQRDSAGVFLVGAEQHVERRGVAEQGGDGLGVAAAVEHAAPGAGKAGQAPADIEILEQEALDVIGLHGPEGSIRRIAVPR
jgi:hypothetical protein